MLAPWLNHQFSKRDGLKAYLCSVRFAKGVFGIPAAVAHFFPGKRRKMDLTRAEQFILIERLSNVSGRVPQPRVDALIKSAQGANLLTENDVRSIRRMYAAMISAGIVRT